MAFHQHYPQPPTHNFPFELNKDFTFSAAHYIPNEKAGPCQHMHGHNYTVNLTIAGRELDDMGFLVNFSDLKKLVHGKFDHSVLNDNIGMPSTEMMAVTIYNIVQEHLDHMANSPEVMQVLVRETDSSYVIYRP